MKTAKVIMVLSLTMVLCLGVMGSGMAAGGNGYGSGAGGSAGLGSGAGTGTGICTNSNIVSAPEVIITGTVAEVCNYGQGIIIDPDLSNDGDEVQVFGIGPVRYWEFAEVARPLVGDLIEVTGRAVTFGDDTKIIIFSITFFDSDENIIDEIDLRDPDTGLPLWRGAGRRW